MVAWVRDMTPLWSPYNAEVTHFIQRVGGPSFGTILEHFIAGGVAADFEKASHLLSSFEGANMELCMALVARTDDRDIWNRLHASLFNTGIVSGEFGTVQVYEWRAKEAGRFMESANDRVRTFATELKASFEETARREFERASIDRRAREIEFKSVREKEDAPDAPD
jgi:hypothetical protein